MSVNVQWYVPNRVVLTHVEGDVTLELLEAGAAQAAVLMRSGEAPVHSIIDLRHVDSFPRNLAQIHKIKPLRNEPNRGWLLLIADNQMVAFLSSTLSQLAGVEFRSFREPAQALVFLWQIDESLAMLPDYPIPNPD